MPGVKGAGGPPPKRDDQRRHRGELALGKVADRAPGAAEVPIPEANPSWHPIALRWYESLAKSGQSVFYEPSDWMTAWVVAESMSLELSTGEPPKAASLTAWLKAMSVLMVTEGDRRRMRLELDRPATEEGEGGDVTYFDDAARRLRGAG